MKREDIRMCVPLLPEMPPVPRLVRTTPEHSWNARALLLPGFVQASAGHDCDLLVAESGAINAVCHDLRFVHTLAYVSWYHSEAQAFYLEHQEDISQNFAEYRRRLHKARVEAMMEAVEDQQSKHIGNLVGGLQNLLPRFDAKGTGVIVIKQRIHENDIPGIIGDGVALMSTAHPGTVVTHLESERERNERIWKATKVASGG